MVLDRDEGEANMANGMDVTEDALARIAAALGMTVEELKASAAHRIPLRETAELLTLWVTLEDDAKRQTLLATARQMSARPVGRRY